MALHSDQPPQTKLRVLVIGDLHLRKGHAATGQAAVEAILNKAREHRACIAAAVILGDMMHDHAHLHSVPVALCGRLLAGLAQLQLQVYVIPGNHDMDTHGLFLPDVHSLSSFGFIPGVHVLHRPEVVSIPVGPGGAAVGLLLLPYVPSGRLREAVCIGLGLQHEAADDAAIANAVAKAGVRLAMGHQTVRGAIRYGQQNHPAAVREGQASKADHDPWPGPAWNLGMISGHIHEPMTVGWVRYVGSVLQTAFGFEAHQPAVHLWGEPWDHTAASIETLVLPGVPSLRTFRVVVDALGCLVSPPDLTTAPTPATQDEWRIQIVEDSVLGGAHAAKRGQLAQWLDSLGARVTTVEIKPKANAAEDEDGGFNENGQSHDNDNDKHGAGLGPDRDPEKDETRRREKRQRIAQRFDAAWREHIRSTGHAETIKEQAIAKARTALEPLS